MPYDGKLPFHDQDTRGSLNVHKSMALPQASQAALKAEIGRANNRINSVDHRVKTIGSNVANLSNNVLGRATEHSSPYIKQLVDPAAAGTLLRAPFDIPSATAITRDRIMLSAESAFAYDDTTGRSSDDGKGYSHVIAVPGPNNAVLTTKQASYNMGVQATVVIEHEPFRTRVGDRIFGMMNLGAGHFMMPSYAGMYEVAWVGTTGSFLTLIVQDPNHQPATSDVSLVYQDGGAEVVVAPGTAYQYLDGRLAYYWDAALLSATSFGFRWNIADLEVDSHVQVLIGGSASGARVVASPMSSVSVPSSSYGHLFASDYVELLALDNTSDVRCAALSLLTTFMGSTLDNGGLVCGARIPRGVRVWDLADQTSVYNSLTRLTRDSSDFPLKQGCYTWWLPTESQDKDFVHAASRRRIYDETSLWMTMVRDDPTQTVRIKAVQIVEFLTSLPTYTIATSLSDPKLADMLSAASAKLPAVTENDLHNWLKSKAGRAFKLFEKEMRDPKFWKMAGQTIIPLIASI